MTDITKIEIQSIREKAVALLQNELGQDYLVSCSGARYGYVGSIKLEITKANDDGKIMSKMEQDFRYHAKFEGLEADDFGAVFTTIDGDQYKIVGFKPRSPKYPIIARNIASGKNYKHSVSKVVTLKQAGENYWTKE